MRTSDAELLAALTALPDAANLQKTSILLSALGAFRLAVQPTQRGDKLNAHIDIGKIPDDFNQAVRDVVGCHESIVAATPWCVNYIYSLVKYSI